MEAEVTEEQAAEALQQLHPTDDESGIPQVEETAPEPSAEVAEPEVEAVAEEDSTGGDDVESLLARNEQLKTDVEDAQRSYDERIEALNSRNSESERIMRGKYLRKSTVTDNALHVLKMAQSSDGASEAEVSKAITDIESTMNPSSASYVPPVQTEQTGTEDQALVLNSFLNEKSMTADEASEFGTWIQTEASTLMSQAEQNVAAQSLDGFIRIAHSRWQEGLTQSVGAEKRADAVEAVRSVQRTQREAQKATSGSSAAPRKQSAAPKVESFKELTADDISTLVRQSVEQYK